jgi:hypothetical protein
MSEKYIVFDVGCIECGASSNPVGIYDTEEEARKALDIYMKDPDVFKENPQVDREDYFHGEQHHVEIFKLVKPVQP